MTTVIPPWMLPPAGHVHDWQPHDVRYPFGYAACACIPGRMTLTVYRYGGPIVLRVLVQRAGRMFQWVADRRSQEYALVLWEAR